jgi:hypothetical protein
MYQVNDVIRLNSGTLVLVKQIGSDYVGDGHSECGSEAIVAIRHFTLCKKWSNR